MFLPFSDDVLLFIEKKVGLKVSVVYKTEYIKGEEAQILVLLFHIFMLLKNYKNL